MPREAYAVLSVLTNNNKFHQTKKYVFFNLFIDFMNKCDQMGSIDKFHTTNERSRRIVECRFVNCPLLQKKSKLIVSKIRIHNVFVQDFRRERKKTIYEDEHVRNNVYFLTILIT